MVLDPLLSLDLPDDASDNHDGDTLPFMTVTCPHCAAVTAVLVYSPAPKCEACGMRLRHLSCGEA